jgi:hypothetical protein
MSNEIAPIMNKPFVRTNLAEQLLVQIVAAHEDPIELGSAHR